MQTLVGGEAVKELDAHGARALGLAGMWRERLHGGRDGEGGAGDEEGAGVERSQYVDDLIGIAVGGGAGRPVDPGRGDKTSPSSFDSGEQPMSSRAVRRGRTRRRITSVILSAGRLRDRDFASACRP
ncbi:hypothetical protein [Nocardioides alcanivorans]|uniref:hypothetical protein n=1 Tax=Nocardioides alcanivorans TaxID=2897352 RepID=UPI001F30BAAB|nr:hypothetical protein [Nocardioides alcanivorans]